MTGPPGKDGKLAPSRRDPRTWLVLLVTLGVGAWVVWEAQRLVRADFTSVAARQQVRLWVAKTTAPRTRAEWEEARAAIERAIEIIPDDAAFHDARGDALIVAANQPWSSDLESQASFLEAIVSYRRALALRPSEPQTWASLALAHYGAGQTGAPLQEAWSRARALGPYEGHVQPMLMELALATWAEATPEMQQWVQDTFENATPDSRVEINRMAERRGLALSIAEPAPASASEPASGAAN